MTKSKPLTELEAEAKLFPLDLGPATADTLAQYTFIIARLAPRGYGIALAAAHSRALRVNEPLAALLRSQEAISDVGEAATHHAPPLEHEPISVSQAREADAAIAKYKHTIAEQLAGVDGHELQGAARVYLAGCAARDREEAEQQAAIDRERLAAEKLVAEKLAAEQAARAQLAEAAADAGRRARALEAARERDRMSARLALAEAVAARIRRHGLKSIRLESGLYDVNCLVSADGEFGIGGGFGVEFLLAVNDAIDRLEAKAS